MGRLASQWAASICGDRRSGKYVQLVERGLRIHSSGSPPCAGRRIRAAAYDAEAREMFDLGRQSRKP